MNIFAIIKIFILNIIINYQLIFIAYLINIIHIQVLKNIIHEFII